MPSLLHGAALLGVLACAVTILVCLRGVYIASRIRRLDELKAPEPAAWPRLSVIVTACNEALTIEPALRSLLEQDYPNLEIVVIDDRSTDDTGALVDELAAREPRLAAVHVRVLPDGWLGKVHALHRGTQQASGDWLLFADADVHFAPGTLRRTVALCLERDWAHLTLFPRVHTRSVVLEALVATFGMLLVQAVSAHRIGRPGSKAVVGIGAFNLVRLSAFDRTPGFEWLRLELADDTGLALMLRDTGARAAALAAPDDVSLEWYPSVSAMVAGLEKNMFPVLGRFSLVRIVAVLGLVSAWWLAHLFVLLPVGIGWLPLVLVLAWGACLWQVRAMSRRFAVGWRASLLVPLAGPVLVWCALRSTWATVRRGGVIWRGTLYPLDTLRAGQRVKL